MAVASRSIDSGRLAHRAAFDLVSRWVKENDNSSHTTIIGIFTKALTEASIGESLDLRFERIENPDLKDLKQMTMLKSGVLIAASVQVGAVTSEASDHLCDTLTELGRQIGFIFQTVNDLNNLNGIDATSKKGFGQDMILQKKNLVTMTLLKRGLDFQSFHSMPTDEQTKCLEPVTFELVQCLQTANQCIDQLPNGSMRQLYASLLKAYRDKWFWLEEDTQTISVSAVSM